MRTDHFLVSALVAAGCAAAPSNPDLIVQWEVRSSQDLAKTKYTEISTHALSGGALALSLRRDGDYYVASGVAGEKDRYVAIWNPAGEDAYLAELKALGRITWCSDWTSWRDATVIRRDANLFLRLMKTDIADQESRGSTASIQFRYRNHSWTRRCEGPASPTER